MTFLDSILISVFGLGIVFAILIALSGIIGIQSKLINIFTSKKNTLPEKQEIPATEVTVPAEEDNVITAGNLRLYNVDEKTAALIMAIVCDESGIPLSELIFKSIKALD